MLEPDRAIPAAIEQRITAEHFYIPAHQAIYTVLRDMWEAGEKIDLITLTDTLRKRKLLDDVGGPPLVTHLVTFVPTAANVAQYLGIIREKHVLRGMISVCSEGVRSAYEYQGEVEALLEETQNRLAGVSRHFVRRREIREIVQQVLSDIETPEQTLGISTGYPSLDESIGGLPLGAKIVVAGSISGGKSAFLQGMAASLAVERKIPTVIFTFEMSAEETVQRIIQIRSQVSTWSIAKACAEMFDIRNYSQAAGEVAKSPLWVIAERLTLSGIRSTLMQLRPRVAMIDYLQIVPEPKLKGENRTDQLDRMSAETKQMARQLELTIIEASQLTENDKGAVQTRGSKGIAADSDMLLIIENEEGKPKPGHTAKRIVNAKQRNGEKGQAVPFLFHGATTTFIERT